MMHAAKPSPPRILIRGAGPGDLPEMMRIERASFPTPWTVSMYFKEMVREQAVFLAAMAGPRLAGYACGWSVEDEGHLLKIAVDEEFRRQAIGRTLMAAMEAEFQARAVREIWLEARERNLAGKSFYLALGYSEMGRRKKYYSDTDEDALLMMKRIGEE